MKTVSWLRIEDAAGYALRVLADEAPEIPAELLRGGHWSQRRIPLDDLAVDESMVTDHDADPVHLDRRDGFVAMITDHRPLPPLIAIGPRYQLVDVYARLRALRSLSVREAEVILRDGL